MPLRNVSQASPGAGEKTSVERVVLILMSLEVSEISQCSRANMLKHQTQNKRLTKVGKDLKGCPVQLSTHPHHVH